MNKALFVIFTLCFLCSTALFAQEVETTDGTHDDRYFWVEEEYEDPHPGIATNVERLPYNLESWIALGLLGYSLVLAWGLSHKSGRAYKAAVIASAFTLLGSSISLIGLEITTGMSTLRDPPLFPIEIYRPWLLRILAVVTLISGMYLLGKALKIDAEAEAINLSAGNAEQRFGLAARTFHWSMAILFLGMMVGGTFLSGVEVDREYRLPVFIIHKSLGMTLLFMVVLRIAWKLVNPPTGHTPGLKNWELALSRCGHFLLYGLIIAFPISAYMMSTLGGRVTHFYFFNLPLLFDPNFDLAGQFAIAHKFVLPAIFYVIFAAHIGGVIKHLNLDRLSGFKQRMIR